MSPLLPSMHMGIKQQFPHATHMACTICEGMGVQWTCIVRSLLSLCPFHPVVTFHLSYKSVSMYLNLIKGFVIEFILGAKLMDEHSHSICISVCVCFWCVSLWFGAC